MTVEQILEQIDKRIGELKNGDSQSITDIWAYRELIDLKNFILKK